MPSTTQVAGTLLSTFKYVTIDASEVFIETSSDPFFTMLHLE